MLFLLLKRDNVLPSLKSALLYNTLGLAGKQERAAAAEGEDSTVARRLQRHLHSEARWI